MAEANVGCSRPTGGNVKESPVNEHAETKQFKKENIMITAKVGAIAPDFEASAYHKGKFINVKLSDYRGKWVIICFYPGDFTFV